jgi:hypothetical protein
MIASRIMTQKFGIELLGEFWPERLGQKGKT